VSKFTEIRDSVIEAKLRPPTSPPIPPRPPEALNGGRQPPAKAAIVQPSPSKPRPVRTEHIVWGKKLVVTNSRQQGYLRVVFKKGQHTTPRPAGTGKSPGIWFHRLRPGQNPYREALLLLRNPDAMEVVLAIEFGT